MPVTMHLSLDVGIKKIRISSEFDEEAEQVTWEALGNNDYDDPFVYVPCPANLTPTHSLYLAYIFSPSL